MNVLVIQHAPHEPLGYIEDILEDLDISYEYVKVYETNEIPRRYTSHMIIMGGPMGAYEEDKYPFLIDEKRTIREAIKYEIPILGICLGAQLIASSLGCRVYPYKSELGWFEVKKVAEDPVISGLPEKMMVFQWHNDTFDLPNGAKLLYSGSEVKNQAFRFKKAIGLQFHLEMKYELIEKWLAEVTEPEREKILTDSRRYLNDLNKMCKKLIENFLKL